MARKPSDVDQELANELVSHQLDLFRLDGHLREEALAILTQLQEELRQRMTAQDLTELGKQRLDALIASIRGVIDDHYARIQQVVSGALTDLPEVQGAMLRGVLVKLGFEQALPPIDFIGRLMTDVMVQGAPSAEWWKRQATDTAFKFQTALRQGLVQGETNSQLMQRIVGKRNVPGVLDLARRNASALIQTSTQTVANNARLDSFKANSSVIKGIRQVSTLDSHTSDICIAYSDAEWDLGGKPINGTKLPFNGGPPRHWNCRSVLVPITKTFKELGIDVEEPARTTRASDEGQIAATTTFNDFLERKGKAYQDEVLGPGRAQLWRDGKITLQQLLDLKGNPLSLAELKKKYT